MSAPEPTFQPLVPERWADFERLFGERGACGGCWCMTPRLTSAEYERQKGEGNRRAMKALVEGGTVPGILGYLAGRPVSWCSVEPRESFGRIERSRILKPVDERPVWSIACLFVDKAHRGRGLSLATIHAAVEHAARCGAELVEGYPVEPRTDPMPAVFAWPGIASAFLAAGFEEVARRSETRPIMRRAVRSGARHSASRPKWTRTD